MIRENLGYKLLALAIALVIWLYVNDLQPTTDNGNHRNGFVTRKFTVPLEVRKADPDYVVTGAPKKVDIFLEGRLDDMRALAEQQDDISAYVSLLGRKSGLHVLPIIVKIPEDFSGLIRRSSETHPIALELEEKIRREFSIQVDLSGSPKQGIQYKQPEIQPTRVSAYGPAASINAIDRLVIVANQEEAGALGLDDSLPIRAVDRHGQVIRDVELSRRTAHLRLLPAVTPTEKSVLISVNTIGQTPFPYKVVGIEVQPETASVTGNPEVLAGVGVLETEPIVLTNRKQTFTQKVRVVTPSGISIDNDAAAVTVRIISTGRLSAEPSAASGAQQKTSSPK